MERKLHRVLALHSSPPHKAKYLQDHGPAGSMIAQLGPSNLQPTAAPIPRTALLAVAAMPHQLWCTFSSLCNLHMGYNQCVPIPRSR